MPASLATKGRILNVVFDGRFGGPLSRIFQVASLLRDEDLETTVILPRGGDALSHLPASNLTECIEIDLHRLRQTLNPRPHFRFALSFWSSVRILRSLIRRNAIQIVHTNGMMHLQAAVAARLERTKLVWHVNDFITPKPALPLLLPLMRKWAHRIAVSSEAVAQCYFPHDSEDGRLVKVLYAPVDTDVFHPRVDGSRIRQEFGMPDGTPVVGNVGNLTPIKGTGTLISAAPAIKRAFPEVRILIVGALLENRRSYWSSLQRKIQMSGLGETVILTGRRSDIPELLAAMDVYVHPSLTEACPMAVLEASASGLPVVATDVGGTRELIIDGVTGTLIPPANPSELSSAVLALLESPQAGRRMGDEGRRWCKRFSLSNCVRAHGELYRSLLTQSPKVDGRASVQE